MRDGNGTHIARPIDLPCGWLFLSPPVFDVVLGGTLGLVALCARRVANMYPGPVGFPPLSVLLITLNDSLRR